LIFIRSDYLGCKYERKAILMKNILPLCLLLIFSSLTPVLSQKYIGGAGGINIGAIHFDPSGFNQFLPQDYPQLTGDFLSLGGDGYFMYENIIIGGSGHGLYGDEIRFNQQKANIGGGMGFFQIGYDFLHKEHLKFYPLIGLGGGGMTMTFSTVGNQPKNDVVQGNADGNYLQTDISWGSFMIDLGIGFDFFPETEGGGSSPRLGIRAGYQFTPSNVDFRYAGGPITGATAYALNGYYFRIIMGGGGFSKME
jgi:hypothetical protein